MIEPTVGRIVWFWPSGSKLPAGFRLIDRAQPCAAQIVFVHGANHVNLTVADHVGLHWPFESVYLEQDGKARENIPASVPYCQWMPYQKAVAAGSIAPMLHVQKPSA